MVAVRERFGLADRPRPEVIRVGDFPPREHRASAHPPVEQRELGVHARDRPFSAARTEHAQGHALRQDDVEDAVEQVVADQGRGDRLLDRERVGRGLNSLFRRGLQPDHVLGRNAAGLDVELTDLPRLGARLVDHDRDVLGHLCVGGGGGRQHRDGRHGQPHPGAD